MKRPSRNRHPAGRLPPQIERDRVDGFTIGEALQPLQRDHRGHHIRSNTGPAPPTWEEIGEHLIREQLAPMRRQERKNTVHLQKMTRNRLRIQQFPLTLRSPLHTNIVVNNDDQWGDRHAGLFRAFLAVIGL